MADTIVRYDECKQRWFIDRNALEQYIQHVHMRAHELEQQERTPEEKQPDRSPKRLARLARLYFQGG